MKALGKHQQTSHGLATAAVCKTTVELSGRTPFITKLESIFFLAMYTVNFCSMLSMSIMRHVLQYLGCPCYTWLTWGALRVTKKAYRDLIDGMVPLLYLCLNVISGDIDGEHSRRERDAFLW